MPCDTTAEQRIELQRIWDALLRHALWKGVSFQDAEDLVSTSLRNALGHHDATRGALLPFARTILCNGIKNYWRDRKINQRIEDDEFRAHPEGEPDLVLEEKERVESMKRTVEQLSQLLSPEELSFMRTLGKVIEEIGDRAVSETARRLGLPPTKGWDLFRRIQRKAQSLRLERPIEAGGADVASYKALTILRGRISMKEEVGEPASEPLFAIAGAMAREQAFEKFLQKIGYPAPNR